MACLKPQAHLKATYCVQRLPDDGKINWQKSAQDIWKENEIEFSKRQFFVRN